MAEYKKTTYHKGKYIVKNKEKYVGDSENVIYRSSWELKFLNWCDYNPNVVKFSSEETIIPYRSPLDNQIHRYFVDAKIVVKNKTGELKTYIIEIKPYVQTQPPKKPERKTKRYINESYTYIKNQAKWKAAQKYAEDRGWEFKILTEYDLGIKK